MLKPVHWKVSEKLRVPVLSADLFGLRPSYAAETFAEHKSPNLMDNVSQEAHRLHASGDSSTS